MLFESYDDYLENEARCMDWDWLREAVEDEDGNISEDADETLVEEYKARLWEDDRRDNWRNYDY